jgi:flagellar basal body rod protein FlgG
MGSFAPEGPAMLDSLYNALSAMRAHTRKTLVHANNLANVQTPGYRPQTVTMDSSPQGGVAARIGTAGNGDGVDIAEEMLGMMSSERAVQANLAILRASDKTLGVLIDIVS